MVVGIVRGEIYRPVFKGVDEDIYNYARGGRPEWLYDEDINAMVNYAKINGNENFNVGTAIAPDMILDAVIETLNTPDAAIAMAEGRPFDFAFIVTLGGRSKPDGQDDAQDDAVGTHHVALNFRVENGKLQAVYNDSLSDNMNPEVEQELERVAAAARTMGLETNIIQLTGEQQRDGHSCGRNAVMNALKTAKNFEKIIQMAEQLENGRGEERESAAGTRRREEEHREKELEENSKNKEHREAKSAAQEKNEKTISEEVNDFVKSEEGKGSIKNKASAKDIEETLGLNKEQINNYGLEFLRDVMTNIDMAGSKRATAINNAKEMLEVNKNNER